MLRGMNISGTFSAFLRRETTFGSSCSIFRILNPLWKISLLRSKFFPKSILYRMDIQQESISKSGVSGSDIFRNLFKKWWNFLQTVNALIRRRVLRRLIWAYTVCQLPVLRFPVQKLLRVEPIDMGDKNIVERGASPEDVSILRLLFLQSYSLNQSSKQSIMTVKLITLPFGLLDQKVEIECFDQPHSSRKYSDSI